MALGEKLTQARKAAGLTQADVAAKLNGFPAGGLPLGKRAVEAFHGKAACAWRTLRCVHRPASEHRKRR